MELLTDLAAKLVGVIIGVSMLYLLPSLALMKIAKLKSKVKYWFGFSIVPVLAILVFTNLWFVREFTLEGWVHFNEYRNQGDTEHPMALLQFTLLPLVGGWLYYMLFKYLDTKHSVDT